MRQRMRLLLLFVCIYNFQTNNVHCTPTNSQRALLIQYLRYLYFHIQSPCKNFGHVLFSIFHPCVRFSLFFCIRFFFILFLSFQFSPLYQSVLVEPKIAIFVQKESISFEQNYKAYIKYDATPIVHGCALGSFISFVLFPVVLSSLSSFLFFLADAKHLFHIMHHTLYVQYMIFDLEARMEWLCFVLDQFLSRDKAIFCSMCEKINYSTKGSNTHCQLKL